MSGWIVGAGHARDAKLPPPRDGLGGDGFQIAGMTRSYEATSLATHLTEVGRLVVKHAVGIKQGCQRIGIVQRGIWRMSIDRVVMIRARVGRAKLVHDAA